MRRRLTTTSLTIALGLALAAAAPAGAGLPPGFSDRTVLDGVEQPTSVERAPGGDIYVTEKRGTVVRFDGLDDEKPRRVADLRTEVHNYHDRGLSSVVADPGFPDRPFLYVSYTHDAPVGGAAPFWSSPDVDEDPCRPGVPDPTFQDGCEASGRVSRLRLDANGLASAEKVLVEDWCQVFTSHSVDDLAFDRRGRLLITGGEGADFFTPDIGQRGNPANQCDDPSGEGGALRSQDLQTDGDPVSLSGTLSRLDLSEAGKRPRILAHGLRNPFRFAVRPGTDEVWIGDVGWYGWEEIDVLSPGDGPNFGWPCLENTEPQAQYDALDAPICEEIYAGGAAVADPWFAYRHGEAAFEGDDCEIGGLPSAISGISFDRGPRLPQPFDGALLFADYTRSCIWAAEAGQQGRPRRSTLRTFHDEARSPVDLEPGGGGMLYADIFDGQIRLIDYQSRTVEVSLGSRPGAAVSLDHREVTPITIASGSRHVVRAPKRLRAGGKALRFRRWSDGGTRTHQIRPRADRGLTAVYR